jgi:hypothetical protein
MLQMSSAKMNPKKGLVAAIALLSAQSQNSVA